MIRSHDTSPTAVDEANKTRKPREYPRTPFPFDATKSSLSAIVETRESPDEQSDAWEPGSAPHDALAPEILDAANTPLPASAQPRTKYNSIENFRELAGCDDREGLSNSSEARCFKTDSISSFSDTEDLLAELLKYEENPQDFSVEEVQFVEKERHRGCNREDKENSIDEKSIPPETSRKRSSSESRVLAPPKKKARPEPLPLTQSNLTFQDTRVTSPTPVHPDCQVVKIQGERHCVGGTFYKVTWRDSWVPSAVVPWIDDYVKRYGKHWKAI